MPGQRPLVVMGSVTNREELALAAGRPMGAPDICGIPTRRLNWAAQQLAARAAPASPVVSIVRQGEYG
jgi:hypothetical protein